MMLYWQRPWVPRDYLTFALEYCLDVAVDGGSVQEHINGDVLDSPEPRTKTEIMNSYEHQYDTVDGCGLFGGGAHI